MIQVRNLFRLAVLLAASTLFCVSTSFASGPWSWRLSLDGKDSGQSMEMPTSLYVDREKERYYVVDSGRNRLLSFGKDGRFLHAFTAEGQLQTPFDMARDDKGIIWVVEKGRNSLTSIDVKDKKITPHVLRQGERLLVPGRLAYEKDVFYVLDEASSDIALINPDLNVESWIRCPDCAGGFVDFKVKNGSVWALDQLDKKVFQFTGNGKLVKSFSLKDNVVFPVSLAVGAADNVYVLDRHDEKLTVFDAQGVFKYDFLTRGQSRGQLYYPIEIVFDPWGGLCVVEEGNGRIEIFSR